MKLHLEGTASNRDGFGSILRVTANGRTTLHLCRASTTFLMQSDPRVHIGLGSATQADRVEIRWPSGVMQTLEQVAADQILRVKEPAHRP